MSEYRQCPRCRGEGTVLGALNFEELCETCDGEGEIWTEGNWDFIETREILHLPKKETNVEKDPD